jgi:hypothetical protein
MPLIRLLRRDDLRFEHVADAPLQPLQIRLVLLVLMLAFVNDFGAASLTAALHDGDAFDELIHVVNGAFLFHGVRTSLADDAWMNPPQELLQSHPAGIDQSQTIA